MHKPDVLIVGAGPSGLLMACQLAIHHIPFRIIDKTEDHTTQSRALVVQARSLEIFDQMGVAGKAIQHGKIARAIGAFFNGKKVLRVVVNDMGGGLTKFPYLLMLEQSHTERILVEFLKEHGHQVERKTELKSLTQNAEVVTSIVKLPAGQEETIHSKYIIGADGAHSIVREQLGIPFSGKTYQESLFVLDCKAEVDIPTDEMYMTFGETAIGGFFPLTNGRWRILGNIPEALEGKEEITFEDIEKDFAKRIHMSVRLYDPQWISAYHSHHRYASTFRKGRGFLIGDAAHIHSPVGAQGMNTGLQDAYNLAWKLALVLKGTAESTLLDSYTAERITIARNLVRSTDRVFSVVTSSNAIIKTIRIYIIPTLLKLAGPVFQKLKFIQRFAFKGISEIGINYRKSPLSQKASFGAFPHHAPKPGDRLPFITFKEANGYETHTHEKMRCKFFCLFVFSDILPQEIIPVIQPFTDVVSIEAIPMTAQTKSLYKAFGIKEQGYYLIRPDCYIACRSQSLETAGLEDYLKIHFAYS
jgi:2-polyprenyl-6-methoxyphenol hydroxylase-like FAD-dependent oxidoreductase